MAEPTVAGTAPALQKNITEQVLTKVAQFQSAGELKLPTGYSAENALKSAYLTLIETVDSQKVSVLVSCSKESIANALLDMVVQGLSPLKKQCYFIAYGNKLQMSRSYMGSIAVAKRVGGVTKVTANIIYNKDEFSYEIDPATGLKKILSHKQDFENIDDNAIKGAYATLMLSDGSVFIEIMNIRQIQLAWNQGSMKGNSPAHKNFTGEMAKKTVINRACKLFINTSDDSGLYEEKENEEKPTAGDKISSELANEKTTEISFEMQQPVITEEKAAAPENEKVEEAQQNTAQKNGQQNIGF